MKPAMQYLSQPNRLLRHAILGTLLLTTPPLFAQSVSVSEVRTAAAKAYGLDHGGTWVLRGTSTSHGTKQKATFYLDDAFRFRQDLEGAMPETMAYDGNNVWVVNSSGMPHTIVLQEREAGEILAWVLSGQWAATGVPLTVEMKSPGEMKLSPTGGLMESTLTLDKSTSLPSKLTYWTPSGDDSWEFQNYKSFNGRKFPTKIIHRDSKSSDETIIQSAEKVEQRDSVYAMPAPDHSKTTFGDLSKPVEVKRIGPYMFVHPTVNGQDIGWFFLDTGADVMCIDSAAANKLQLKEIGSETTAGVVGVTKLPIYKLDSFALGGLTIKQPAIFGFDLADISKAFNLPLGGICGFDFFARVALDIDPKAGKMFIHKSGDDILPQGAKWTTFMFDGETPTLQCRFEGDHEGAFHLDTGSSSTVDFFTPIVKKLNLLQNRETTEGRTGGAGGTVASKLGKIDWFELAGKRFEKPSVVFQSATQGVFASPYLAGNIGMSFLGQFRMFWDFPKQRLALLPY